MTQMEKSLFKMVHEDERLSMMDDDEEEDIIEVLDPEESCSSEDESPSKDSPIKQTPVKELPQ